MINKNIKMENSGENSGVMVQENHGTIHIDSKKAPKIPSLISDVIKLLGNVCMEEDLDETINIQEFKVDDKIEYNCVIAYRELITEFSMYYWKCDRFLNAYDNSHIRGKAKILQCIRIGYLNAKGKVLLENKESEKKVEDIIRDNSDRIIDMVKDYILEKIKESGEMEITYQEDIELGIISFICYCFMKCKILEKPL